MAWSAPEELRLRELAGTKQVRDIARILAAESGTTCTHAAVSVRAKVLGISLWWDGYSQNQVADIFGVWFRTVARWRTEGLLTAEPWEVGRGTGNRNVGPVGQWHITDEALRRFIDRCTWAYDLASMPPGQWRSRAEVAHHADPWLTVEDLVQVWHVNARTVRLWAIEGKIPHKRRHAGNGLPKIMVRATDLPGLRQQLREIALSNVRAGIVRRDQRRKAAA